MTRKPTRNYSLSVVAASVAVLAILTLSDRGRLEIRVTGSANRGEWRLWTLTVSG